MKYAYILLITGTIILMSSLSGCKKEDSNCQPILSIRSGGDYTSNGSYLNNHNAKIGIIADGGGVNITNLVIKVTKNGTTSVLVDQGFNDASIDIAKALQISQGDSLTWTISVMNKDRNSASISFFTRDTTLSYGEIWSYSGIRLGMQNSSLGTFFDPFTGTLYTASTIAGHESSVHILGYYYITSGLPSFTFSSAGDSDAPTYYSAVSGWSTKNYTDWDYVTSVTTASFDAATNDSLLVASFHSGAGFSSRKYKFADAGKVVPFKTTNNKTGLIKVNAITASDADAGYIDFDIKIQK